MFLKTLNILFVFVLSYSGYFSQEICDNGIDDDGNGFIDLQDTACHCKLFNFDSITSFIPNHSFEDTICCPFTLSQMHCAVSWQQASASTSDYFNLCGKTRIGPLFNFPPMPIADGNGYCGFYANSYNFGSFKEYIGTCLTDTMFAGTTYRVRAQIAYGTGSDTNSFELFGTDSCSNLPFPTTMTQQCPINGSSKWISLGSVTIILDTSNWNAIEITFTPTKDITTIVIGPACVSTFARHYYYLDDIILNELSSFKPKKNEIAVNCQKSITLEANAVFSPNSYQWYKDSIALVGETSSTYFFTPNNPATYQVRLMYDSGCSINFYELTDYKAYELKMPNVFSPNNDNVNDIFKPIKFKCISEATLNIYNRWGQIVYESSEIPFSWDGKNNGKDCSAGIYFWTIDLNGKEGVVRESGNVTLFR